MFNLFKTLDETKLDPEFIEIRTSLPVYITMSTIPSRMKNTFKIIDHFLKHVTGFEKLILNIPYKYSRFPHLIIDTTHNIKDSRFILNRTEDIGPLTKFLPSIPLIPENSITIICDDMCYKLDAFKDIAALQDHERNKSFSFYVYPYSVDNKTPVHVPQGADLISTYSRNVSNFQEWYNKFRDELKIKKYYNSPCFFVDDQVIGWFFQYNNIPVIQVDRKHRNIYIKHCDRTTTSNNLNKQKGKHSRENTMKGCYQDLDKVYPFR